ncbi:hypothetical protein [Flavobacterium sp. H122]|uniref:hypothetical protein n=1 Tax=Flavobacterium sp. H122 TaxID=2529860 RepID=UPI0010AAA6AF|nr:hypothetical protein [Flavobacterium sp. H122]
MRKTVFIIYVLSSLIAVFAVLFDFKLIEIIFKPLIVPAVFVYYLYQSDFKLSGTFTSVLILSFASDMISIFDMDKKQLLVILLNLAINMLFLKSYVKDYLKLNTLNTKQIFNALLILLGLLVLVVICLTLIPDLNIDKIIYYLFYGLVLAFMSTVAIYNSILNNNNLKIFYAVIISTAFIITDVFYVLYNFYLPMKIFLLVNLAVQFVSYFFIVNYFTVSLKKI